jgi:hypothetical protein
MCICCFRSPHLTAEGTVVDCLKLTEKTFVFIKFWTYLGRSFNSSVFAVHARNPVREIQLYLIDISVAGLPVNISYHFANVLDKFWNGWPTHSIEC